MKKNTIKELLIGLRAPFYRIGLRNKDFSIISNNCWGGVISRNFHLSYNSPTCGLYFFSEDYIRFVSSLHEYLSMELVELDPQKSRFSEIVLKNHGRNIIMGKLGDIEIVFLHYVTFTEAKEKWNRRIKRINFDNLLVKYSDQNLFQKEHFEIFKTLPYANKVFITADQTLESPFTYFLPDTNGCGYVKDDIKPSFKIINLKYLLNNLKRVENN